MNWVLLYYLLCKAAKTEVKTPLRGAFCGEPLHQLLRSTEYSVVNGYDRNSSTVRLTEGHQQYLGIRSHGRGKDGYSGEFSHFLSPGPDHTLRLNQDAGNKSKIYV